MNARPNANAAPRKLDPAADAAEIKALEAVAGEPARDPLHMPPSYRYVNPIGQVTHVREGLVRAELERRAGGAAKASKKA